MKIKIITSRNTPNKRLDLRKERDVEKHKDDLDAIKELFVRSILYRGRIKNEHINSAIDGSTFLAEKALELGLIDEIKNLKNDKESIIMAIEEEEDSVDPNPNVTETKKESKSTNKDSVSTNNEEEANTSLEAEKKRVKIISAFAKNNPSASSQAFEAIENGTSAEDFIANVKISNPANIKNVQDIKVVATDSANNLSEADEKQKAIQEAYERDIKIINGEY